MKLSYAQEGSAAHALAESCFRRNCTAASLIGHTLCVQPTAHSDFGASSCERYILCPASIQAQKKRPSEPEEAFEFDVTEEMAEHIDGYMSFCNSYGPEKNPEPWAPHVELEIDLTYMHKALWGRADYVGLRGNTLKVVDLKYGKGVMVDAQSSDQLKFYGLGAYHSLQRIVSNMLNAEQTACGIEQVVCWIYQPRIEYGDKMSCVMYNPQELYAWGRHVLLPSVKEAESTNPRYNPGEKQCRWCNARYDCTARMEYYANCRTLASGEAAVSELVALLGRLEGVSSCYEDLKSYCKSKALEGEQVPGYKLVKGRSTRFWTDPNKAEWSLVSRLGSEAYSFDLVSVTQAEKKLKRAGMSLDDMDCWTTQEGGLNLVPESHKGKEVKIEKGNEFSEYLN